MHFLRTLNVVIVVYIILLSVRILRTWFHGSFHGKPWEMLIKVTDPYLSLFSGIKFLRQGMFDFSPIAAIFVLVVLLYMVNAILYFGRITLGLIIGSVLSAAWWGLAFLLLLFLILAIIRAFTMSLGRDTESSFSRVVRLMIQPLVALVVRYVPIKRQLSDIQYLYLTIAILFIFRFLGGYLIGLLVNFFITLPI